ncbi:MAG TPA: aconitate hydratase B, partial [Epsilonproteobacteria bacterium]|nr:aconitate hydratase B [Campylobacterota bacterium]
EHTLIEEGYYAIFGTSGARTEIPGCSLCMGNQAQVGQGAYVFSTSTRNFDNRLGKDSQVYLGSAELAAVVALQGKLPTAEEYMELVTKKIKPEMTDDVYRYLNFNKVSKEDLEAMVE